MKLRNKNEMNVQYYNTDRYGLKGTKVHKSMQDFGMPILDIFVRESIQNSLDAQDDDNKSSTVVVEYLTGEYDLYSLAKEFEGIDLRSKRGITQRFLAVRDRNTLGLTGGFDDENSKLYKLTGGFMDSHGSEEETGGSWGLGKTIYFRLGIGLVIFYSRTKLEDGSYQSLMTATMVEDETQDPIIPAQNNGKRYGIAFWGVFRNGVLHELRDEETINRVLAAFSFQPYGNEETGTAILIPSIKEDELLSYSCASHDDSESDNTGKNLPYWLDSLDETLRIAVQRWYPARLNNLKYSRLFPGLKSLTVRINGNPIRLSEQRSFSTLLCDLYTKAALAIAKRNFESELSQYSRSQEENISKIEKLEKEIESLSFRGAPIELCQIDARKVTEKTQIGQIAYIRIKRSTLDTDGYSFYDYTDIREPFGSPIMVFSRRPGMIVSYKKSKDWLGSIKVPDDEYLIAYFVLNSNNTLSIADMTLERYIRLGENSMHDIWEDKAIPKHFNPQKASIDLVYKVRQQAHKKILEGLTPDNPEEGERRRNSEMSSLLGSIFFPVGTSVTGSGRATDDDSGADENSSGSGGGGSQDSNGSGNSGGRTISGIRFVTEVAYGSAESITVAIGAKTLRGRHASGFITEIQVASTKDAIPALKWFTDMGIGLPFVIDKYVLKRTIVDGESVSSEDVLLSLKEVQGDPYALSLSFPDGLEHSFDVAIDLILSIRKRDARPVISFEGRTTV